MEQTYTAPIFNIQTYCIHDGPGIRTTVFLKGCPLRCLWCANPESNAMHPQLMTYRDKCTGCGRCTEACPNGAVHLQARRKGAPFAFTDRELCKDCGNCVNVCPSGAREIAGKEMTVEEVLKEVLKDKLFLTMSGGGITLSGGEALARADFSSALLAAAKENGLHTAIETSSFAPRPVIDKVFSQVDLGLLDIKHMDSAAHKKLTGVPNELILDNIQHIYHDLHVPVIIRIPAIPGYNADMHNIAMTARFVREKLSAEVPIHLLPYHALGESKAESLGLAPRGDFHTPEDAYMETLKSVAESYGIHTQIGG